MSGVLWGGLVYPAFTCEQSCLPETDMAAFKVP